MSQSLWELTAEQLLQRASSADPTPGGGAIAAVTAAFGLSLIRMAIEVTISTPQAATPVLAKLGGAQRRAGELQAEVVEAADRDIADFESLMAGYRLPHETDEQVTARRRVIADATLVATRGPLGLAEACVAAIGLGGRIEPLVKATIVSDVHAGCDLLRGATQAALRTVDINLGALEEYGHPELPALRRRRDAVQRAVTGQGELE